MFQIGFSWHKNQTGSFIILQFFISNLKLNKFLLITLVVEVDEDPVNCPAFAEFDSGSSSNNSSFEINDNLNFTSTSVSILNDI